MTILQLPVETICKIFLTMLRSSVPSYAEFNSADTILGVRSLIHTSNVCHLWRDIVVSDAALWSTIWVSLRNPSVETLHQMNCYINISLERSMEMPVTCIIYVVGLFDMQLLRPLMGALVVHQKRWMNIRIVLKRHLSAAAAEHEEDYSPFPDILLHAKDMAQLKHLLLSPALWFPTEGLSCQFLTTLHLADMKSDNDITAWLHRSPNLQKLSVTASSGRESPTPSTEVTIMEKLRILDVPPGILGLLQCPVLEVLTLRDFQARPHDLPHFRAFIRQNSAPLQFLCLLGISRWMSRESFPEYLRLIPAITSLSLLCTDISNRFLLEMLAEKITIEDIETLRVFPALEHLRLDRFKAPCALFIDMITTRWNMPERRLKSITLSHCSDTLSDFPRFHVSDDPATLPVEWNTVKQIVGEGLRLQILFK